MTIERRLVLNRREREQAAAHYRRLRRQLQVLVNEAVASRVGVTRVAELTGFSRMTLYRWRKGESQPRLPEEGGEND